MIPKTTDRHLASFALFFLLPSVLFMILDTPLAVVLDDLWETFTNGAIYCHSIRIDNYISRSPSMTASNSMVCVLQSIVAFYEGEKISLSFSSKSRSVTQKRQPTPCELNSYQWRPFRMMIFKSSPTVRSDLTTKKEHRGEFPRHQVPKLRNDEISLRVPCSFVSGTL